ncbi:uncharacterized protein AMSG_09976, partial [Thecamonas trahens ATCC 50062]
SGSGSGSDSGSAAMSAHKYPATPAQTRKPAVSAVSTGKRFGLSPMSDSASSLSDDGSGAVGMDVVEQVVRLAASPGPEPASGMEPLPAALKHSPTKTHLMQATFFGGDDSEDATGPAPGSAPGPAPIFPWARPAGGVSTPSRGSPAPATTPAPDASRVLGGRVAVSSPSWTQYGSPLKPAGNGAAASRRTAAAVRVAEQSAQTAAEVAASAASFVPRDHVAPPREASLAHGLEGSTFDAGLAMARSFRVSWGPGGLIAFPVVGRVAQRGAGSAASRLLDVGGAKAGVYGGPSFFNAKVTRVVVNGDTGVVASGSAGDALGPRTLDEIAGSDALRPYLVSFLEQYDKAEYAEAWVAMGAYAASGDEATRSSLGVALYARYVECATASLPDVAIAIERHARAEGLTSEAVMRSANVSLFAGVRGIVGEFLSSAWIGAFLDSDEGAAMSAAAAVSREYLPLLEVALATSWVGADDMPNAAPEAGIVSAGELVDALPEYVTALEASVAVAGADLSLLHMQQVYELVDALWGHASSVIDGYGAPDGPAAGQSALSLPSPEAKALEVYHDSVKRTTQLSEWLARAVSAAVEAHANAAGNELDGAEVLLEQLFAALSGCQLSTAAQHALALRDFRLATVLAQTPGSPTNTADVAAQLALWRELGADKYVAPKLFRIYALLAGDAVTTAAGLDWKRALGLQLWFGSAPNATIASVLDAYTREWRNPTLDLVAPPLAHYLESGAVAPEANSAAEAAAAVAALADEPARLDTAYHLLHLYCGEGGDALEKVLLPTTASQWGLDERMPWTLYRILRGLGYADLRPAQAYKLHGSFAAQLENVGLWEWGVFVLLHLPEGERRRAAVLALLERHVRPESLTPERQSFLVETLGLPRAWLHHASAVAALYDGDYEAVARHWLEAGEPSRAHEVIVSKLAPQAVLDEDSGVVLELLEAVEAEADRVSGWAARGWVFLTYLRAVPEVEFIVVQLPDELSALKASNATSGQRQLHTQLVELDGQLSHLAMVLSQSEWAAFAATALVVQVCGTEMATRTALLLARIKATLQAVNDSVALSQLSDSLSSANMMHGSGMLQVELALSAPLPPNYRISVLNNMAYEYAKMIEV